MGVSIWSVRLGVVASLLLVGTCRAQLDVPFFMPRLATNLMGEGRPEAGSLESLDALSQYPCYGNACERLNRNERDGWDDHKQADEKQAAGNPAAIGSSARRVRRSPPVPAERVPDPQVLVPTRATPTSMFVDGEVRGIAQQTPVPRDGADSEEPIMIQPVMIENLDEARLPPAGTSGTFPTQALPSRRIEESEPSTDEPVFPANGTSTSFPLTAEAARAEATRIQKLQQELALQRVRKAYAARMAPVGPGRSAA